MMHARVLPFVLCILNVSQMQREKSTDGQDILKLFALLYVILERKLVPDSQLEIQIKETPQVASPGAEE